MGQETQGGAGHTLLQREARQAWDEDAKGNACIRMGLLEGEDHAGDVLQIVSEASEQGRGGLYGTRKEGRRGRGGVKLLVESYGHTNKLTKRTFRLNTEMNNRDASNERVLEEELTLGICRSSSKCLPRVLLAVLCQHGSPP